MTDVLKRLTDALADKYAIEHELGAGGMATVYLAHDLKHDRKVAVKVLRPDLAAAIGTERFLREIQITAKLNHAHILPLLNSGSIEEQPTAVPPYRRTAEDPTALPPYRPTALLYYVMPYVEGESLRDRLNRETKIPIDDALALASEVADALGSAHRQNLIHRDIKPENILLREGHAVMADFGIALAITAAHGDRLTETGLSLGTPTYMSPEQIEGVSLDGRSDIYALGCVLFELMTGRAPFEGPTPLAVAVQHQADPPRDPREFNQEIPNDVSELILRCLEKEPAKRYQTAEDLLTEIEEIRHPVAEAVGVFTLRSLLTQMRRPVVAVPAIAAVVALVWVSVWFSRHRAEVRWAREVAIPEIERMIEENDVWRNLVEPYRLAEQAEVILGDDPALAELFTQISLEIDIRTDPPGARVYAKEYAYPDSAWTYMGVSPLEKVRMPIGFYRWKLEKEGYETVLAAASTWNSASSIGGQAGTLIAYDLVRTLDEVGSLPPGMVRVPATQTPIGELDGFFIDRYEVTNRAYKAFVDAGGYRNRSYWSQPFRENGRELSWDEAMARLVDQTGQPGPSTWVGGTYPQGQDEHPVSGLSWYEAAAFADFSGKSLPTRFHWLMAAGYFTPMIDVFQLGGYAVLAPFSNYGDAGLVPVGSRPSLTPYGAYDMAGNVREWCWNETPQGRMVRGGAWYENPYTFRRQSQASPWDRSEGNGMRLARFPERQTITAEAFRFEPIRNVVDFRSQQPVPETVFQVYKEQFSYDETPLNSAVEFSQESPGGWIRELVSFDAAYGGERVLAHLFLPANTPAPYQAVVYFPGVASMWTPSSEDIESYYEFPMFLSYLVRNGRAVVYPVYKGTFERQFAGVPALGARTHQYTEYLIQLVEDFRRCIDYLETREDIDSGKLAYYGLSWGGWMGAIIPAVEERLGASVLLGGGLNVGGRPEVYALNYVTRVKTPTLMLNGEYDINIEMGIKPMFDLLGTPDEDKKLILYDTDHIPPRAEYIKETVSWLDKYLGPVVR